MDRAEATGLGVAVAGHAALVAALALGLAVTQRPPQDDAMEVSFMEEVGPVSTAPEMSEAPAPALGEELAPVEEAAGSTASVPEPITAPIPEPVRPPIETGERRRPDLTRNPVQIRSAPPPRITQQPRPQQRPQVQRQAGAAQPQQRRPSFAEVARSVRGSPQGQEGSPGGSGTSNSAPAALTGAQRQQIARNISGLIRPCATNAKAPNPLAQTIKVDLRVTVTREGVPTAHRLVRSTGTDSTNSDYVDDVVAVAMRSVRACASRIATLPAEFYENGWRTFNYRFNFN